jgi:hypothetical protein
MIKNNLENIMRAIEVLSKTSVMVGVPSDNDVRKDGKLTNATLMYIHEHGAPEHNIPARPVLKPGVKAVESRVIQQLARAAKFAIKGDGQSMFQQFHAAGMVASQSAKNVIRQGVAPPLKAGTVQARLRRTARGQKMLRSIRQSGANIASWGASNMKPLWDTGQLLRSITYVLRIKGMEDIKGQDNGTP